MDYGLKFLVTGGAGFIGSALIRHLIKETDHLVLSLDKLTYAGNLETLLSVSNSDRYQFVQADICDRATLDKIFDRFRPDIVIHLAAESHVDRSIDSPDDFVRTNVVGTYVLLEAARSYWVGLDEAGRLKFRFHHVSTDEVYGDLEGSDDLFKEETPYAPSSPYSATKASADHLVRAWGRTFGLPVVVTNCSNNYGPFHFPEKLIPHMILNALAGLPLPVYGTGRQIRDWLYVEDHARALVLVATKATAGETYNIGGHNEVQNIDVVEAICDLLDELQPEKPVKVDTYHQLIEFVADRPGHDARYAIDASKIERDLGWRPYETFETGLRKTVLWYLENREWLAQLLDGNYKLDRLGQQSMTSPKY